MTVWVVLQIDSQNGCTEEVHVYSVECAAIAKANDLRKFENNNPRLTWEVHCVDVK